MRPIQPVSRTCFLFNGNMVDIVALRAEGLINVSGANVHTWNGAMNILVNTAELAWNEGKSEVVDFPSRHLEAVERATAAIVTIRMVGSKRQQFREENDN